MTAKAPVPSLSDDGWVYSNEKVTDYLLCHFFEAEYSQTYIYDNKVSSLPYLLFRNNNNPTELCREMISTLQRYFGRYFNDVVVEVSDRTPDPLSTVRELSLYMQYTDIEGEMLNLGRLIATNNLTVTGIFNL
jgi:hypothetical protein